MADRYSMVFYESFYRALVDMPDDVKLEVLNCAFEFAFYGNEIEMKNPVSKSLWMLIKPQIEANNRKAENGKKGGRPRKVVPESTEQTATPVTQNGMFDERARAEARARGRMLAQRGVIK